MAVGGFNIRAARRHGIDPATLTDLSATSRVAELMAQECSLAAIADICGYSDRAGANSQVQRVRRSMGPQAR